MIWKVIDKVDIVNDNFTQKISNNLRNKYKVTGLSAVNLVSKKVTTHTPTNTIMQRVKTNLTAIYNKVVTPNHSAETQILILEALIVLMYKNRDNIEGWSVFSKQITEALETGKYSKDGSSFAQDKS